MLTSSSNSVISALFLIGVMACSNSNSSSPTSTLVDIPAGSTGKLSILLTDLPTDDLDEINVFITELRVKKMQEPVATLTSGIGLIDLLTLQGGITQLIADDNIEAGIYEFIQFVLDEDQSFIVHKTDGRLPLKIPSRKIRVQGGHFEIEAGSTTTVLLDFDAESSLSIGGNGRYRLKPVIAIVNVAPPT